MTTIHDSINQKIGDLAQSALEQKRLICEKFLTKEEMKRCTYSTKGGIYYVYGSVNSASHQLMRIDPIRLNVRRSEKFASTAFRIDLTYHVDLERLELFLRSGDPAVPGRSLHDYLYGESGDGDPSDGDGDD